MLQLNRLGQAALLGPNSSFNPNPLRSTNNMAGKACHVVGSTTQVGLTQALGLTERTRSNSMSSTKDRKIVLSTLWIFVTLNYLYCDILTLMSPEMLNSLITTGGAGGIDMNETTLLGAAILLEIPIGLVLLSRILKYKANRLANIIASVLMTLVMIGTLLMGGTSYHYIRSKAHTSELQSLMRISYAVFCLKKKTTQQMMII